MAKSLRGGNGQLPESRNMLGVRAGHQLVPDFPSCRVLSSGGWHGGPRVPKFDFLFPSQPHGQVVHVGLNLPQRDCASQPQVLPTSTNPNTSAAKSRYPAASWIPPGCPAFHNKASSVGGAIFQASQGQGFMLSLSLVTATQWWAGPQFGRSG